jgi:hypothetical protein
VSQRSFWQLHSPSMDFHSWLSSQSCYTLCFDGDSKGNLGEAGAGGVLYGPRGTRELDFYWNLGIPRIIRQNLCGFSGGAVGKAKENYTFEHSG